MSTLVSPNRDSDKTEPKNYSLERDNNPVTFRIPEDRSIRLTQASQLGNRFVLNPVFGSPIVDRTARFTFEGDDVICEGQEILSTDESAEQLARLVGCIPEGGSDVVQRQGADFGLERVDFGDVRLDVFDGFDSVLVGAFVHERADLEAVGKGSRLMGVREGTERCVAQRTASWRCRD